MYNVLHVFTSLDRGGAETFIMNVYRNIDRDNISFDFIVQTDKIGDYEEEIKTLGGKIFRIPPRNRGIRAYKRSWDNFFKDKSEYDAIHFHRSCFSGIYPIKAAYKSGIKKIVIHSHNTSVDGLHHRVLHYINKSIVAKYSTDYIACSKKAADWLYNKNILDNVEIINNGIDAKRFRYNPHIRKSIREAEGLEGKFVIGHVGRFAHAKNHEFLIDVFLKIKHLKPNAVLFLVGRGELIEKIESKVMEYGLQDSVIFAGLRSNIDELMQGMDIFVLPSLYEGLPVTLIEAQAAGLRSFVSEAVTNEASITNLIEYLPINKGIDCWVDSICNEVEYDHHDTYHDICKIGYDIGSVVDRLEGIYLKE